LISGNKIFWWADERGRGDENVKEMWLLTFGIIPAFLVACKIRKWRLERQEQELDKAYFTPNPALFGRLN